MNFFHKIKALAARLFPERQLYFRTNGVVRFISISHNTQIFAASMVFALLIWSLLTSYSYLNRAEILAAKDMELAKTEQRYNDANQQFQALKQDIQSSTKALEQRQIYLQQLLDADSSLSSEIEAATQEKDAGGKGDEPGRKKPIPHEISFHTGGSTAIYDEHQKQLDNFKFSLNRIETQQQALAERMVGRISQKIAYVEKTLKQSGLAPGKLMQLAENRPSSMMAMGGPFILYSEQVNFDLSTDEPFAKLYAHHNHLIDLESVIQHIPIGMPTKKYYISSNFGVRKDPFKKTWARHSGVDMAGWWKNPIYSSANGRVTKAGRNGAYGNFIEIDHGNGFLSRYGHLSKILVKKGELVTLEQKIGLMGSTGRSTSPHLHYEIWFNGKPINPQKIFKASNNVLKIQRQEYDS